MSINSKQKRQEKVISLLNMAIETMNLAKEVPSVTPVKAVFGSVSVLLIMIRVRPPTQLFLTSIAPSYGEFLRSVAEHHVCTYSRSQRFDPRRLGPPHASWGGSVLGSWNRCKPWLSHTQSSLMKHSPSQSIPAPTCMIPLYGGKSRNLFRKSTS